MVPSQTYATPVGHKKTILIVDDDQDFRDILATKLAGPQTAVLTAVNGSDGLSMARTYHPDLILLDIDMPVLNGIETFRELKADSALQKLNVVFLTNYDEPVTVSPNESDQEKERLKPAAYIRKSSDLDVIAAYVEGILLAKTGR